MIGTDALTALNTPRVIGAQRAPALPFGAART